MDIGNKILSFILFIIIVFVILNQLIKLSVFAYKYYNNYIIANINKMSCGNYFSESEHPRFQISKNIYDLHIDNDIFNSKTYIIIIYIFSIIFYLYAYVILSEAFSNDSLNNEGFFGKGYINSIIMLLLIVLSLVYFITVIIFRFDKGDEEGYKRFYSYDIINELNGYNKYASEVAFYTIISIILTFNIILLFYENKDKLEPGICIYILYAAGFYMFALYLMNNLFNIVLSFKNNEYPLKENEIKNLHDLDNYYDKTKNTNVILYNNIDISYGSENYFYKQYLEYSKNDWWFDIYNDIHDIQKMEYKTSTSYNISNLKDESGNYKSIYTSNIRNFILIIIIIITCSILLFGLLVFVAFIIDKYSTNYLNYNYENIKKFAISIFFNIISPLLILFIIIFVIIATMEYNTFINRNILININKKYKEDLNDLNNSIIPVLYVKNKKLNDHNDAIKYSYIIYNVISSYLINTINIFDISLTNNPISSTNEDNNEKIITIKYIINDTISPYKKDIYNISSDYYNNNYNINLTSNNIISNIKIENENYSKDTLNNYIDNNNNYTPKNTDGNITNIINYYNKIFKGKKINYDINYNIKNNILCSMYNIDNYSTKSGNDKVNFFRNYIFNKKDKNIVYFNQFLLKANLDNSSMDLNKYKIYETYIDDIIKDFKKDIKILNYNIPIYNKSNNQQDKERIKITIINAFDKIKNNLKISLNKMIDDFTSSKNDSNNIIFKNITDYYKRSNDEESVTMRAYDISNNNFTNKIDINNKFTSFDNKLKNIVKDNTKDIDLLKLHEDIVKNANFVINERLYILIATYVISLFIAYKLVKN